MLVASSLLDIVLEFGKCLIFDSNLGHDLSCPCPNSLFRAVNVMPNLHHLHVQWLNRLYHNHGKRLYSVEAFD